MFTGLVQTTGELVAVRSEAESRVFLVRSDLAKADLALGASVACGGVCLTVTAQTGDRFEVQAAFETLRLTTLEGWKVGDLINLEPSLRVGDPLGGHLVSGHVDGIGTVRSIEARGDAKQFWVDLPQDLRAFVATKGSIAVDGVSLTVNDIDAAGFTVGLIPHTLGATTLGSLAAGGAVNIEVDVVARYVARLVEFGQQRSGVSHDLLREAGFIPGGPH